MLAIKCYYIFKVHELLTPLVAWVLLEITLAYREVTAIIIPKSEATGKNHRVCMVRDHILIYKVCVLGSCAVFWVAGVWVG